MKVLLLNGSPKANGNTAVALHEMVENDLLHPGQTLACIGFGGGLTWGGMLLTYEGRK